MNILSEIGGFLFGLYSLYKLYEKVIKPSYKSIVTHYGAFKERNRKDIFLTKTAIHLLLLYVSCGIFVIMGLFSVYGSIGCLVSAFTTNSAEKLLGYAGTSVICALYATFCYYVTLDCLHMITTARNYQKDF